MSKLVNTSDVSEVKGFNTRYDMGDLRELRNSMEEKGFDEAFPLIVRNDPEHEGKYLLGSQGHRRLTVARDLELKQVYVVVESEEITDFDRNLDIMRLNTGKELTLLEQTRVVMRALEVPDKTQTEVAKLLGKSAMFVTNCVKLSKTTKQTQKWIEGEKIGATSVLDLIQKHEVKTDEDYKKLEERVEKLIESSKEGKVKNAAGKNSGKDKEDKEEETAEEKEAREEKEKEEAEVKALNKKRMDAGKRGEKFFDSVQEAVVKNNENDDDKLTPFQSALLDLQVSISSYISGKGVDTSRTYNEKGEPFKLSDVWASVRAVEKAHKETLKETVSEVKTEAKEAVAAVKSQVKEVKTEAAKKIAAAKAKVDKKD